MVAPQMAMNVEAIFDEPSNNMEITQENHCCKPCCVLCIREDKFAAKTALNANLQEESSWFQRNCIPYCCTCWQKEVNYNFDVGSVNALKYHQECVCLPCKGMIGDVSIGGRNIGSVGLPLKCCSCGQGCTNCCIDCTSWGGWHCTRGGFGCCSCHYCLCMGCKCLPTRVYDTSGVHLYNVLAPALQCGTLCGGYCCDPCLTTKFDVLTPDGTPFTTITRFDNRECWICRPADKFTVAFPPGCQRHIKQLIFASAISLHYLYYDI